MGRWVRFAYWYYMDQHPPRTWQSKMLAPSMKGLCWHASFEAVIACVHLAVTPPPPLAPPLSHASLSLAV